MNTSTASPPAALGDCLTVTELAARYRVHKATIWRLVARGVLPNPFYVGDRSPRWSASETDAAFRARRESPKAAMERRRRGAG